MNDQSAMFSNLHSVRSVYDLSLIHILYSSHDNPGRRQPDETYRKIDKVGPFNYKGLVTPWEDPLDVYYMYRANYVPAAKTCIRDRDYVLGRTNKNGMVEGMSGDWVFVDLSLIHIWQSHAPPLGHKPDGALSTAPVMRHISVL